uniref:Uncharacterized protein n=1 Tax=Romanomermis culicivorax TaxID=13658 RepID=A0A915HIC7_ROMCU
MQGSSTIGNLMDTVTLHEKLSGMSIEHKVESLRNRVLTEDLYCLIHLEICRVFIVHIEKIAMLFIQQLLYIQTSVVY